MHSALAFFLEVGVYPALLSISRFFHLIVHLGREFPGRVWLSPKGLERKW